MSGHRLRGPVLSCLIACLSVLALSGAAAPLIRVPSAGAATSQPGSFHPLPLRQGGTLTVLEVGTVGGEWATGLDPGTSYTPATNMDIENSVFGSLFELVGPSGQLVPDLATGYQLLDGGRTVQVFIRKGVRFSDGTPFDAAAVVYNWNRDFQLKDNDLPNWPLAASNPFTVAGPYTAVIHFAIPYTPVINTFHIHDVNWIVSPAALSKLGEQQFRLTPVGAGPFTVVSNTVNSEIVLKRNPLYWQKGLPYLDKLIFKSVASDESALEALQAGQAQAYVGMSTLQLLKAFQSSFTVTSQETADPLDVQLNTTKAPFDNILAREAIYYATDAPLLDKRLFHDVTPVVEGFTGPGGLFYRPRVPGYRTYDLAKAKALVKRLGGLSFTLLGGSSQTQETLDEALQTEWEAAGMKVKLVVSPDLTARIQTFLQNDWQASPGGDGSYDPAGGVGDWFWFLSTSPYSGVHDPTLDALIEKANEVPEAQRGALYQQIAKYQSDHAYAVQLFPSFEFDVADRNVYAPCLTTVCPTSEVVPEVWWQNAGYRR
jgi:peptide/nickel transport system substrate-binding protein